jgi:hypothetical protein
MRRVLRSKETQHFITDTGDTTHFHNGLSFAGFKEALGFCLERNLGGVELVLMDHEGQEQMCIGVT